MSLNREPGWNVIRNTEAEMLAMGYKPIDLKKNPVQKGDMLCLMLDEKALWAEIGESTAKDFRKLQQPKAEGIPSYRRILRK